MIDLVDQRDTYVKRKVELNKILTKINEHVPLYCRLIDTELKFGKIDLTYDGYILSVDNGWIQLMPGELKFSHVSIGCNSHSRVAIVRDENEKVWSHRLTNVIDWNHPIFRSSKGKVISYPSMTVTDNVESTTEEVRLYLNELVPCKKSGIKVWEFNDREE